MMYTWTIFGLCLDFTWTMLGLYLHPDAVCPIRQFICLNVSITRKKRFGTPYFWLVVSLDLK